MNRAQRRAAARHAPAGIDLVTGRTCDCPVRLVTILEDATCAGCGLVGEFTGIEGVMHTSTPPGDVLTVDMACPRCSTVVEVRAAVARL